MKKRIISLLLLVSLLVSCAPALGNLDPETYESLATNQNTSYTAEAAWNGSASDTSWYTADPLATTFTLSDGADLKGFVGLVSGGNSFEGKTVKLGNDINLGDKLWSGVGGSPFKGTFDGQGYTIGGFQLSCTASDQSLLGALGGNATLKNLQVRGANVIVNASADLSNIGIVISCVETEAAKTVSVENLFVSGHISDRSSKTLSCSGGIIGAVKGEGSIKIGDCIFEGEINSKGSRAGGIVGGITGNVNAVFTNCTNRANITANEQLAGIVGSVSDATCNTTFEKCVNDGNITLLATSTGGQAAGIVGRYSVSSGNLVFSDCHNTGTVAYEGTAGGGTWLGGLGGYLLGNNGTLTSLSATNSYNTGKIIANRTSAGLFGFVQQCGTLTITDCWSNADLQFNINATKNPYVGGLVGMIHMGSASQMKSRTATISGCSVAGSLTIKDVTSAASYTGGLIGALRTSTVNVSNSSIDLVFSKQDCEEDDIINVTLGYNQDSAAVLNADQLSYYHHNNLATAEDFLLLGNENTLLKKVGVQYRVNAGADGVTGTSDDTYDLRYVFGVQKLAKTDTAIGFELSIKSLGETVITEDQIIYCPFIYESIQADGETVSAKDYNAEYLFTLVISGIPAESIETEIQNGYAVPYLKNKLLDIVSFSAETPEATRNPGEGVYSYGLQPDRLVFQVKHLSPSLPKAFAGTTGIIASQGISFSPASNLNCQNAVKSSSNDQYTLQKNCTCGGEGCAWSATGTTAERLHTSVPYHYSIDEKSFNNNFSQALTDRYEAYHTWSFEVEEDGYYEFCFRIRLQGSDGSVQNCYALVQIDNESYGNQTELFYSITTRDGTLRDNASNQDSYMVGYGKELKKGTHTITFRLPYDANSVVKSSSFQIRDIYLVRGAAPAGMASIPTLDGATLYDGNFDNTATYVLNKTNYQTYLTYLDKLEAAGFALCDSRTTSYEYREFDTPNYKSGGDNQHQNHFRTYTNDDYMVHVYFAEGTKNLRVVVSDIDAYNSYAKVKEEAEKGYTTVTTPLFAMLDVGGYTNQGICFIYRLSDGRFVIVDGGQWNAGVSTDDIHRLYSWLKEHADYDGDGNYENNKVVIAAWLFTHLHSDHMNVPWKFEDLFGDKVEIQHYMYNFPSYEYARSMPNSNLNVDYYTVRYPMMHKLLSEYDTLVAHTGFVYQFADLSIEILFTHEDFFPSQISDFNNSSTVFKISFAGKTFLVAGDLEEPGQKSCNKMAGSLLDSDFLQITHHGWNGQLEFYQYIVNEEYDSTIVLWPLPNGENSSQFTSGYTANRWIKENMKEIHYSSENYIYDFRE